MAMGDLDNDGRSDLVISHVNEPVALLRNQLRDDHHWVGIELVGDRPRDPIGARVDFSYDTRVYKAAYTWLFYDTDKVTLGASFGLNVVDFGARLTGGIGVEPIGETEIRETTGVTAPLPVLGLRISYRPTRTLNLVAAADILVVEYGKYSGT